MQITETVSEGLRREYKVVIVASDLDARLSGKIAEMQPQVHLKGFRPGKAPTSYLKKTYGKSMMSDIVQDVVNESSQKAINDNSLKPAMQPQIDLISNAEEVVGGKSDLEFTLKIDLMPEFDLADLAKLEAEKLVSDVTDADVDEAIKRIAEQTRGYTVRGEGEAAQKDDAVVIDFVGSVDGVEFAGGKGDDFSLTLGSGQFIPGFEDQLIGAKAGEQRDVNVTFPAEYQSADLAGKAALFKVVVKEVKQPDEVKVDDELATKVGLDSLATLKERVREQIKSDYTRQSRMHLKRRLLDALDKEHSFPLPPAMVEGEFGAIWNEVEEELKRENKKPEDEGKSEDELKQEYRGIAERRVRLGLVLAKIAEQNSLTVTPDEVNRAVAERARQFPGQEQQIFNYFANNPQALAQIRAPMIEEKAVDFIAELAKVTERQVDRETLFSDPDEAAEKLKGK